MKFRTHYEAKNPQINLAPLVDVVFQLLLFFMVSISFAFLPQIQVDLPNSQAAENAGAAAISICLKDGEIFLGDEKTDFAALQNFLRDFRVKGDERAKVDVEILADKNGKTQELIEVFDALRQNGFSLVNLRTEQSEKEKDE